MRGSTFCFQVESGNVGFDEAGLDEETGVDDDPGAAVRLLRQEVEALRQTVRESNGSSALLTSVDSDGSVQTPREAGHTALSAKTVRKLERASEEARAPRGKVFLSERRESATRRSSSSGASGTRRRPPRARDPRRASRGGRRLRCRPSIYEWRRSSCPSTPVEEPSHQAFIGTDVAGGAAGGFCLLLLLLNIGM